MAFYIKYFLCRVNLIILFRNSNNIAKKIIAISLLSAFVFWSSSCTRKNQEEVNQVLLCALDALMTDYEFRHYLIGGDNYIAWVHDGYVVPDSINKIDGRMAWNSIEYIDVDDSYIEVLNNRFPEGHKLQMIKQQENEDILRNKNTGKLSTWFFGGMKKYKNRYYLKGGFAKTTKWGIGASFEIEIIDGKCHI